METSAVRIVFLNNHLIGMIATGTVILTVLIFLWLYYFYVERLSYVRYTVYYFFAALVGLMAESTLQLNLINGVTTRHLAMLNTVSLVTEVLTIYSVYLLFSYYLKRRRFSEKLWMFIGFTIAALAVILTPWTNEILSAYAGLIFAVIAYKAIRQTKRAVFLLVLLCGSAAMFAFNYSVNGILLIRYQWIWELVIAVGFIVNYMSIYKGMILEKGDLLVRFSYDGLTGSASKSSFMAQLSETPRGRLFFVDINKFKKVNDLYGHAAGDRLLAAFSSYAEARLIGLWSRFGGDEFTLLVTEGNENMVAYTVEVLQDAFKRAAEELEFQDIVGLGISIGTVSFSRFKGYPALEAADAAMYEAKETGNWRYREGEVVS